MPSRFSNTLEENWIEELQEENQKLKDLIKSFVDYRHTTTHWDFQQKKNTYACGLCRNDLEGENGHKSDCPYNEAVKVLEGE